MEQRKSIRTAVFSPVLVISGSRKHHGLIMNISLGGAYIETKYKYPVGDPLVLAFTFPSYPTAIVLSGRVVRNDTGGIGVEFGDTPSRVAAITVAEDPAKPDHATVRRTQRGEG